MHSAEPVVDARHRQDQASKTRKRGRNGGIRLLALINHKQGCYCWDYVENM